jgi:ribosomal protein S18 acetylase RimI-like enzyme
MLAERLVHEARSLGYATVYLDTLAEMAPARTLYGSLGFRETTPYYDNPLPDVKYLKLDLGGAAQCDSPSGSTFE